MNERRVPDHRRAVGIVSTWTDGIRQGALGRIRLWSEEN